MKVKAHDKKNICQEEMGEELGGGGGCHISSPPPCDSFETDT
jgi:hypothetical protein